MKKLVTILACVLIAGFALESCNSSNQKMEQTIENSIKNAYPDVKSSFKDGKVTLRGDVETESQKMAVENTVKGIAGVKTVENNINVKQKANNQSADDVMRSNITSRLNTGGYSSVKVAVNNGEVTLTGDLNRSELTNVMQLVNESNPVKVNNNLNLR